ncbi:MAG: isoprenylcysteine carboxylmethyltransferase family protein [Proteobacteria bacterium]|nr:isoprenylcysteine carboxylmethyltransferase family protein [Pseudomonadota bacterium]
MLPLAGVALAAIGQAFRATVIGFAYVKRGGLNKRVYASNLVTTGLFGVSRNPLYLGNFLILVGLFLVHGNPFAALLGIALFLVAYRSIVATEEAYLTTRFAAEYQQYCRAVPRWLPDLRRLRPAIEGMSFDWRRVVIKDYGTACTWVMGVLLLLAYAAVYRGGWAAAQPQLARLAVALVAVLAASGLIRYAKKAGWLVARAAA